MYNDKSFRVPSNLFTSAGKNVYASQLKSTKGLDVVYKGIESDVDSKEIKDAPGEQGFKVRSVMNIFNRSKFPQPIFNVELEPDARKLKKLSPSLI